ncbi:mitochondrial import inner membrane translocase subunit tim21 [Coemansia javaensis]|uniref:Mitochondrial import inner membrane translocase subunit Tim21 n=1 Tax=Coemansia javaensis TaxID=2761396 RepID=A0A9W8HIW2_9FUNG|nr:mitochondrial import inner membrane translocase subunit tim21 [Coemansia javaensis]
MRAAGAAAALRLAAPRALAQAARRRRRTPCQPHALPALPQRRARFTLAGGSGRAAQAAGTAGNVLLIGSVVTLFGYIMYTLYENLVAEHGVTRVYNASLDLLRANPQIKELLGPSIVGFGEPTHSQRQRQRAIAHRNFVDAQGRQRLYMQYYVKDTRGQSPYQGVVKVDMAESKSTGSWDYNYIVVDLYQVEHQDATGTPDTPHRVRVEVLVTDEFAREIRQLESQRRSQRFSTAGKKPADGSWFGALRPGNWTK